MRASGEARIGVCRCASWNAWDCDGTFFAPLFFFFQFFIYMLVRGVHACVRGGITFSVFILDSPSFFFFGLPSFCYRYRSSLFFFLSKGNNRAHARVIRSYPRPLELTFFPRRGGTTPSRPAP